MKRKKITSEERNVGEIDAIRSRQHGFRNKPSLSSFGTKKHYRTRFYGKAHDSDFIKSRQEFYTLQSAELKKKWYQKNLFNKTTTLTSILISVLSIFGSKTNTVYIYPEKPPKEKTVLMRRESKHGPKLEYNEDYTKKLRSPTTPNPSLIPSILKKFPLIKSGYLKNLNLDIPVKAKEKSPIRLGKWKKDQDKSLVKGENQNEVMDRITFSWNQRHENLQGYDIDFIAEQRMENIDVRLKKWDAEK